MIALAYTLCVLGALLSLAVALRHRPAPTPPTPNAPAPAPLVVPNGADAEVRVILTAAHQLAARLAA